MIGKTVRLDDDPITIIGVMPRGFRHPVESGASPMELWAPIALDNPDTTFMNVRGARVFDLIGRIKPGATVDQLQAQLLALTGRLSTRYPDAYPHRAGMAGRGGFRSPNGSWATSGRRCWCCSARSGSCCSSAARTWRTCCSPAPPPATARSPSGPRWAAAACASMRQLLTESVVLAALGGLVGLLIAAWGTSALGDLARLYLPRAREIGIDRSVLGFTAFLIHAHRPRLRNHSRVPGLAAGPAERAQGRGTRRERGRAAQPGARRAGGDRGRRGAGAAGRARGCCSGASSG